MATMLDEALRRLQAALSALEAAAERRIEADRSKEAIETELTLMQDDRARLAVELDGALAWANRLETVGSELARRVDSAIDSVRFVLEADEPAGR